MSNNLIQIEAKLSELLKEKAGALPKNFNQTRFLQNCLTVLKELGEDKLKKLSPESIALTMVKGAFLGLDFFNRECYAIPFANELQFLTDYKGDMKLARQYSIKPIKNIYAELVREEDIFFCEIVEGRPTVNFKPKIFSDNKIIGAFAVVIYADDTMNYAVMSEKEIQATRQNWSKCPNSPAWVKAQGEMYKKTVLKRLTKMIELNFDNAEQDKAYQDGSDLKTDVIDAQPSPEIADPFLPPPAPTEEINSETGKLGPTKDQVKIEIQAALKQQSKPDTLIYKYAKDLFDGKVWDDLTIGEALQLKDYIETGAI